jgi:hypothetical protein
VHRERRGPGQEADDEVRSRGTAHVKTDRTDECRHAEGSENHADGPTDNSDHEREHTATDDAKALARTRCDWMNYEIGSAPEEDGRDDCIEDALGDVICQERPGDRSCDRGRRGPRDHVPVDTALPCVPEAARPGSRSRDGDVGPCRVMWIPGREDEQRKAQRPEDEPEHGAEVARDERSEKR